MSGSFADDGQIEWGDGLIVLAVGKKKSGKSIINKVLFSLYPGDKIVLDVNGDDGPAGEGVVDIHGDAQTLPRRWPESERKHDRDGHPIPMTLRYVPDPGSPTVLEDMDAVVGLALAHGRHEHAAGRIGCALLIHEVGVVVPVHQTKPHMRRALMHNRHNHLTLLMCGPRPAVIDPLVIQQADLIYTFELLNPADRKRLAETMGWHPADFDESIAALRKHEYLRFDANEDPPDPGGEDIRLVHFPPLPEDVVRTVL